MASIDATTASLIRTQTLKTPALTGAIEKPDSSACSVSLILDLAPGILTTAACIIGVVALNVLKQPYLSIPSMIGTLTGACTIYQGYQAHLLKTFHENNEELKASIVLLNQQNEELKTSVATFKVENKQLAKTVSGLEETSQAIKEENLKLTDSNNTLQENVKDLQSINVTLENTAKAHVERLEGLKESLSGIQNATEKDHTQFAQHLAIFSAEVENLQETSAQFEATGSTITKTLVQTAEVLQGIFTKVNDWKSDKYVASQIELQQKLHSDVVALEKQITRSFSLDKEEKKSMSELAQIKEGFERAVNVVVQQTAALSAERAQLQQTVGKFLEPSFS